MKAPPITYFRPQLVSRNMFGVLHPERGESLDRRPTPPDDSPPPPMSMAGPPPGHFSSREDMLAFIKEWAEGQGYAIVIGRSRLNRLWLKCDRGGVYTDRHGLTPENRKRQRGETRLTDCPFKVLANVRKDGIWRSHTEMAEHNHGPSEDLSIHPSLRRMTDEQIQKVNEMTEAGNSPLETLEELQRLWPGIKVLRRDIYNARKKYKTEKELAEMAQGLHEPQPYDDPNGRMPGPTRTGRWEWLEEGDEIKRKKRTKVSQFALQSLDPLLRESGSARVLQVPTRRQAQGLGTLPPEPFQPAPPISAHQQRAQATLRVQESAGNSTTCTDDNSLVQRYNQSPSYPVSEQRQKTQPTLPEDGPRSQLVRNTISSECGIITSGGSGAPGTSKAPSGQVLMSRIERMEKEQREQKTKLDQILQAVLRRPSGGN